MARGDTDTDLATLASHADLLEMRPVADRRAGEPELSVVTGTDAGRGPCRAAEGRSRASLCESDSIMPMICVRASIPAFKRDRRSHSMPARSTPFQEVIFLKALMEGEGTVVESAMLSDTDGNAREVDVLVQRPASGVLAIECREHGRAADVTWVDQVIGKYSRLPVVESVALASRSGFSAGARKAAQNAGIALVEPVTQDQQAGVLADEFTLAFARALIVRIVLFACIPAPLVDAGREVRFLVSDKTVLHRGEGPAGTVGDICEYLMEVHAAELAESASQGSRQFLLPARMNQSDATVPRYYSASHPDDGDVAFPVAIDGLVISGVLGYASSRVDGTPYVFDERNYRYGQTALLGVSFSVLDSVTEAGEVETAWVPKPVAK